MFQQSPRDRLLAVPIASRVLQPIPGGGVLRPMPGGNVLQPKPGGSVLQPMPGGEVLQPMSGGKVLQPMPGGGVLRAMPGYVSGYNPPSSLDPGDAVQMEEEKEEGWVFVKQASVFSPSDPVLPHRVLLLPRRVEVRVKGAVLSVFY
jgi:hypothetical protein